MSTVNDSATKAPPAIPARKSKEISLAEAGRIIADAKVTPMDMNLSDRVAALGRELTPESLLASQRLFAPLHGHPGSDAVEVYRDLAYGDDPRHRLDAFVPRGAAAGARPVLLFVPGGGFVGGDKRDDVLPFHDNVGHWAARQALVGITMNYRLAPQNRWPSGAQDVAAAVHWLSENAARFGGDPARIVALGTSAGATHVAGCVAGQGGGHRAALAGAVMVSGIYDKTGTPANRLNASYFGRDESCYDECFPIRALSGTETPLLVAVAEFDPPEFQAQTLALLGAFFERQKRLPAFHRIAGHNHYSTTLHLGTEDTVFANEVLRFIANDCQSTPRGD